jgi:hypothetical protein
LRSRIPVRVSGVRRHTTFRWARLERLEARPAWFVESKFANLFTNQRDLVGEVVMLKTLFEQHLTDLANFQPQLRVREAESRPCMLATKWRAPGVRRHAWSPA